MDPHIQDSSEVSPIVRWLEHPLIDNSGSSALVSAIPFIGGPLQALISGELQKIKNRRWEEFAILVQRRLDKLETKQVDFSEIRSDEFLNRFQRLCAEVVDRADLDKLKYLRSYLINTLLINSPDTTTKEVFFSYIQRCSGAHLIVLGEFYALQGHLPHSDRFSLPTPTDVVPLGVKQLMRRLPAYGSPLMMMLMNDLEALGVVRIWQESDLGAGWSITDAGVAFYEFVAP